MDVRSRGRAVLLAAVAGAATVVLGIELLSRAGAVRWLPTLCLAGAATIAAAMAFRRHDVAGPPLGIPLAVSIALAAIGGATLVTALVAAPNTWDSMTYHLPRVAHWAGHGSVAHYPTSIDRQLWQPPLGEYLMLIPYVLTGGDRLANLPAWLASAGCVLVAVEIGRLLGLSAATRALAALAVATLPPLVLESTSTQTDVTAAFWVGVVAYLALAECAAPSPTWQAFAWIGAALGLAIGTKGTALPLGLPWALVALAPALRARRLGAAAGGAAVMGVAVAALNTGHWLRNLLVFNGPLGPSSIQTLLRPAGMDPASVAGNLLANATVHLGTPWAAFNDALGGAVRAAHAALGLDVAAQYPYFGGYRVDPWSTHENVAGAPLHLLLAAAALVLGLATWRRRSAVQRAWLGGLLAATLLLGASVRWQPFNARLHLPLLVVAAPGLALAMRRLGPAGTGVAIALVVACVPALVGNATRPLWTAGDTLAMPGVRSVLAAPRDEQYFASRRDAFPVFVHLGATIRSLGCADVRLHTGYDGWEYPAARMLGTDRLEHVFVENASVEIGETPLRPGSCVVVLDERADWRPPGGPLPLRPAWSEGRAAVWIAG